jgi:iron complex transport system permease protein
MMKRIIFLALLACFAVIAGVAAGPVLFFPPDIADIISSGAAGVYHAVLFDVRIPRVLLAAAVGASLSVSGVIFQAVLKNPLADPYIIGVSGGAALGATIASVFFPESSVVIPFSLAGGTVTVSIVFLISLRLKIGGSSLLLAGLSLGFITSSMIFLIFAFADPDSVHRAVMWMMGDLSSSGWNYLVPAAGGLFIMIMISFYFNRHLDIISFGERFHISSGIGRLPAAVLFLTASFLTAVTVSLCGVIGFVGLIAPHIARAFTGPRHIFLIPSSALIGALFLVMSDAVARTAVPPYELPVGVVTGFAGGIFFLILTLRRGER